MIRACAIGFFVFASTMMPSFAEDAGVQFSKWVTMPNAASGLGFKDISAKGRELWALDENNAVNRFNSADGVWKAVPTTGLPGKQTKIAASPDGWSFATAADMLPYRFNPETNTWVNDFAHLAPKISAIGKDSWVFLYPGDKYRMQHCYANRNSVGCPLEPAPANANGRCLALGDENEKWFMSNDKKIYRLNNTSKAYQQILAPPQCPDCLDAQCPNRVVLTSKCGRVYLWSKDHWYPIPNMNDAKVATIDYNKVYVVTYDKKAMFIETPAEYACGSECPCGAD